MQVKLSELRKIGKVSPCAETGQEFTFVYELFVSENVKLYFNPDEVLAFDWVLEADFKRMILLSPEKFTPSFIKVYNFYLSETKK